MPTCRDMAELATDYLDGTLPWYRRWSARLHLHACQACRNYFDQMRRTIALLRGAPPSTLSESEATLVLQKAKPPDRP
ncbi:MAG: zf-HC2 domain-containing protein [Acetobacteraceae bacterium]|nr:zf-HC2 domain-containing protein [Pseudomonadota bacterium]